MRKSIALLITLFFLLSVVFVINLILKDYKNYTSQQPPYYITQNSLIIKNTISTLSKLSDKIKTSDDLKKLFTTIPLSDESGNFRVIYTIEPLFDKIDINSLLSSNKINPYTETYIDNILSYYQIKDPLFFKNLLLDTIDKDSTEREAYSEIRLADPYFQNGKIYNFKHLETIENFYYKKTDDKNIYDIPWDELIFFGDGKKHILECSLISPKVAKFLGFNNTDKQGCKEIYKNENNETIKNFNIIAYGKSKSFWIKSDITYYLNGQKQNIEIVYDIHNKKVISIESHPLY